MATPATPHSRPRGNAPAVGEAVPRTGAPAPHGGGVLVPGGYDGGFIPWGFGGLGLYGGYYGGYYDPWFDPYYGGGYYAPPDTDEQGSVHLKVKPRDASVFVDGYYAGVVDDFDGVFQRLHIDPGPHRIEISAPGYDTLSFEVRVLPGQTVTYRGELKQE